MITDQMVEIAARAIIAVNAPQMMHGWSQLSQEQREAEIENGWDLWEDEARAALTAALGDTVVVPKEPVGWFNPWNDYHGIQQVASEHEGEEHVYPLYCHPDDLHLVQLPEGYSSLPRHDRVTTTGGV